jgi:hypothetical protein
MLTEYITTDCLFERTPHRAAARALGCRPQPRPDGLERCRTVFRTDVLNKNDECTSGNFGVLCLCMILQNGI